MNCHIFILIKFRSDLELKQRKEEKCNVLKELCIINKTKMERLLKHLQDRYNNLRIFYNPQRPKK